MIYASASTSAAESSFTLVSLALDQSGFFYKFHQSWERKREREREEKSHKINKIF